MLTTSDHDRDAAGLTYVYPVLSRRSGGLSIGINLNPNNACNWRCIYCQVPGLVRGVAPAIDLQQLQAELEGLLHDIASGEFQKHFGADVSIASIRDIALSGNGEPTSAEAFARVVECIGRIRDDHTLDPITKTVLITNGSLVHKPGVQEGLKRLREVHGEVWFKLDRATRDGMEQVNNAGISPDRVRDNLRIAANLCPTWLQSCFFRYRNENPDAGEIEAYLKFIREILEEGVPLEGVQVYGIERPSKQPEAPDLEKVSPDWLEALAGQVRSLGLPVVVKQ